MVGCASFFLSSFHSKQTAAFTLVWWVCIKICNLDKICNLLLIPIWGILFVCFWCQVGYVEIRISDCKWIVRFSLFLLGSFGAILGFHAPLFTLLVRAIFLKDEDTNTLCFWTIWGWNCFQFCSSCCSFLILSSNCWR